VCAQCVDSDEVFHPTRACAWCDGVGCQASDVCLSPVLDCSSAVASTLDVTSVTAVTTNNGNVVTNAADSSPSDDFSMWYWLAPLIACVCCVCVLLLIVIIKRRKNQEAGDSDMYEFQSAHDAASQNPSQYDGLPVQPSQYDELNLTPGSSVNPPIYAGIDQFSEVNYTSTDEAFGKNDQSNAAVTPPMQSNQSIPGSSNYASTQGILPGGDYHKIDSARNAITYEALMPNVEYGKLQGVDKPQYDRFVPGTGGGANVKTYASADATTTDGLTCPHCHTKYATTDDLLFHIKKRHV